MVWAVFLFLSFSPQHCKQALELSLGVQIPICAPLEALFNSRKLEERRKGLGSDSCQEELWSGFMKKSL